MIILLKSCVKFISETLCLKRPSIYFFHTLRIPIRYQILNGKYHTNINFLQLATQMRTLTTATSFFCSIKYFDLLLSRFSPPIYKIKLLKFGPLSKFVKKNDDVELTWHTLGCICECHIIISYFRYVRLILKCRKCHIIVYLMVNLENFQNIGNFKIIMSFQNFIISTYSHQYINIFLRMCKHIKSSSTT